MRYLQKRQIMWMDLQKNVPSLRIRLEADEMAATACGELDEP